MAGTGTVIIIVGVITAVIIVARVIMADMADTDITVKVVGTEILLPVPLFCASQHSVP